MAIAFNPNCQFQKCHDNQLWNSQVVDKYYIINAFGLSNYAWYGHMVSDCQ